MKIFYTVTKSEAGGAQTHVYQLAKNFTAAGHTVVIMSSPNGWLEKKAKELGVKFLSNPYFSNTVNPFNCFRAMSLVKQAVTAEQPDIVHAHSSGAGFYTRVAIKNKFPTVYTAHGWGFNIGVPFWQKYLAILGEKIGTDFCHRIICVSEFVKNLGLKYRIAKPEKFVVVHNGVEYLGGLNKPKDSNKSVKIIFVGRLAAPKLPNLLLEAVAELPDDLNKKLEIKIIGGGDKKEMLENYAREMRLDHVKLYGDLKRQEVLALLLESDIFVLLSRYEGLPLTILEAMSAGLPVIASRVGGISEAVDESNGILVKNNVEEVKMALAKLANDAVRRESMGKKAQQKISQKFLLEDMIRKTEEVYKEILK